MTDRIEHWDRSLTSKLIEVQSKLNLSAQLPPDSVSRSNLLSDASGLLTRCRLARSSYRSELNKLLDSNVVDTTADTSVRDDVIRKQKHNFENRLEALEEGIVLAEDSLVSLQSGGSHVADLSKVVGSSIAGLSDVDASVQSPAAEMLHVPTHDRATGKTYHHGSTRTTTSVGTGGCQALPDIAIGAETRTYDKIHSFFDPLLDFATTRCGCDPISFAEGTGGKYEPQNSVVEEYDGDDDNVGGGGRGGFGSSSELFAIKSIFSPTRADTPLNSLHGGVSSNLEENDASKLMRQGGGGPSEYQTRAVLEERGKILDRLNNQTQMMESGAKAFADTAAQLRKRVEKE